jgi:hypothetical protein
MISNHNPSFKDYCCSSFCGEEGKGVKIRHLLAETTIVGEIADLVEYANEQVFKIFKLVLEMEAAAE